MTPRSTSTPSYRRALLAGVIALGLGLGPRPAYSHEYEGAAPEGPNPFKEQVEALNAQAVEKFQAKQYDEAAALFEQAYDLNPEPNYLFNPAHPDFRRVRIGKAMPFAFDPRLL